MPAIWQPGAWSAQNTVYAVADSSCRVASGIGTPFFSSFLFFFLSDHGGGEITDTAEDAPAEGGPVLLAILREVDRHGRLVARSGHGSRGEPGGGRRALQSHGAAALAASQTAGSAAAMDADVARKREERKRKRKTKRKREEGARAKPRDRVRQSSQTQCTSSLGAAWRFLGLVRCPTADGCQAARECHSAERSD